MSTVLSIQVEFTQYFFIMYIAELSMTGGYGILACIWFVQLMERHLGQVYLSLFFPYVASFTLIRFYLFVRREKIFQEGWMEGLISDCESLRQKVSWFFFVVLCLS